VDHGYVGVEKLDVVHDDGIKLEKSFRFETETETDDPDPTSLDGQAQGLLNRQRGILFAMTDKKNKNSLKPISRFKFEIGELTKPPAG
jgi:hypothetical protein